MPFVDRTARRVDLKLVYWGPARGGKTTSLRSLHGAFSAPDRGELNSVQTEDERTYFFDYAPLDLPKWRDLSLRVHAYTVPGQEHYVETRWRILRGADGVIFVADASPAQRAANVASWRQLDAALLRLERGDRHVPVVLAVNKVDLPEADRRDDVLARLLDATPSRAPAFAAETAAIHGMNVVACFREALLAAVERTLPASGVAHSEDVRRRFLADLASRLPDRDDGAAADAAAPRSTVVVQSPTRPPDSAGLEAALDSTRRLAAVGGDLRDLERRHSLARLLLDLGALCLSAADAPGLAQGALTYLVPALGASFGWVGCPDLDGADRVYDTRGPALDAPVVARLARGATAGVPDGEARAFTIPPGCGVRASAEGLRSLVAPFAIGEGRRGYVLVVGPREGALEPGAEDVLGPAGAYVGLALARLSVVETLRDANAILERRVDERTAALRRERDTLEERVRERSAELEDAKRTAVEAERRLLDRERGEVARRLAAGLAHELNNPIGAARADVEHAADTLERVARAVGGTLAEDLRDAAESLSDARAELSRVAASVSALFSGAPAARRAAVRTPLGAVVRDAVAVFSAAHPLTPPPSVVDRDGVACGVPPGECARWLGRLLDALTHGAAPRLTLEVVRNERGPSVFVASDAPVDRGAAPDLDALRGEVEAAGGALEPLLVAGRPSVRLVLPRAVGETAAAVGASR